ERHVRSGSRGVLMATGRAGVRHRARDGARRVSRPPTLASLRGAPRSGWRDDRRLSRVVRCTRRSAVSARKVRAFSGTPCAGPLSSGSGTDSGLPIGTMKAECDTDPCLARSARCSGPPITFRAKEVLMITRFDKLATELPHPAHPSANDAAAVQELLGGKFGEMSTFMNYTFQS